MKMRSHWSPVTLVFSLAGAEVLFGEFHQYSTAGIAALQESEQEAAQTAQTNAATLSTLLTAGFTAESAVAYVASGDLSLLVTPGCTPCNCAHPANRNRHRTR